MFRNMTDLSITIPYFEKKPKIILVCTNSPHAPLYYDVLYLKSQAFFCCLLTLSCFVLDTEEKFEISRLENQPSTRARYLSLSLTH